MPFILFSVVAAVTPGPSNIMLTTAGANAGIVRGVPCLLGVTAGMGLMMFLVPLGLGTLVLRNALLVKALHWAGAAVLLWLAWKIARSSPTRADKSKAEPSPVGFVSAAVFQWVNPKAWLVSASAAGTFLHAEGASSVEQAVYLGGLFALAALPSGFVWLVFGATVQRVLQSPRRQRAFNLAMGGLLAMSIALVAW